MVNGARSVGFWLLALTLASWPEAFALAADAPASAALMMSGARVVDQPACSFLTITFTTKIGLVSSARGGSGDEMHIKLAPLVPADGKTAALVDQESLHAPTSEQAAVHAIELAYDPSGALLSLYFKREVAVAVAAGADGKSLRIGIPAEGATAPCEPGRGLASTPEAIGDAAANATADSDAHDQHMNAIRTAIAAGDVARAKVLIAEAASSGDRRYTQELEELVAMAHEKAGERAQAEEAYRRYLEHYPSGPGAARVQARLKALDAVPSDQNAVQSGFVAPPPDSPTKPISDGALAGGTPGSTAIARTPGAQVQTDAQVDPDAWRITQSGSTSVFYYRNEGGRDVFVPPRLQLGWDRESVYKLYQDSVVGSFDYNARFEKGSLEGRMRVSTARDQDFIDAEDSESSIYAANIALTDKASGVSATLGRQTLYSGGVLGRFDGALASFKATTNMRISAVAGAPVWRSSDSPFQDSTYFYGVGANLEDFKLWDMPLEPGVYYFHQNASGITDREAVGGSLGLHTDTTSVYAAADYDIHYGALNEVAVMASYMFANQALIGINADYRRAPLIFTSNALQGQPVATLSELLRIYTHADVEQFAMDRTAHSFTLDVNYTLPIGENWQFTADAYLSNMGGTKESGAVPATVATGTDFYAYAQLTRSNLFADADSYSVALRYGNTSYDNLYAIELAARYPITKDWSIGPNLRLGYSGSKTSDGNETQVMPSLRLAYRISEDATLDMEVGKKWIERDTIHGVARETELMALVGVRYDFYTK